MLISVLYLIILVFIYRILNILQNKYNLSVVVLFLKGVNVFWPIEYDKKIPKRKKTKRKRKNKVPFMYGVVEIGDSYFFEPNIMTIPKYYEELIMVLYSGIAIGIFYLITSTINCSNIVFPSIQNYFTFGLSGLSLVYIVPIFFCVHVLYSIVYENFKQGYKSKDPPVEFRITLLIMFISGLVAFFILDTEKIFLDYSFEESLHSFEEDLQQFLQQNVDDEVVVRFSPIVLKIFTAIVAGVFCATTTWPALHGATCFKYSLEFKSETSILQRGISVFGLILQCVCVVSWINPLSKDIIVGCNLPYFDIEITHEMFDNGRILLLMILCLFKFYLSRLYTSLFIYSPVDYGEKVVSVELNLTKEVETLLQTKLLRTFNKLCVSVLSNLVPFIIILSGACLLNYNSDTSMCVGVSDYFYSNNTTTTTTNTTLITEEIYDGDNPSESPSPIFEFLNPKNQFKTKIPTLYMLSFFTWYYLSCLTVVTLISVIVDRFTYNDNLDLQNYKKEMTKLQKKRKKKKRN
eukprot:TRINITY_DN16526_c0_g1_i2.p1 TRINITY_DN16526_c0_g1~~TRINITY_DN16526_c0_g1_i2.p1  ORF type:complete len:519 (+),score=81.21 TRINITY_DN16526_c0_g1_i2:68-1624(+)